MDYETLNKRVIALSQEEDYYYQQIEGAKAEYKNKVANLKQKIRKIHAYIDVVADQRDSLKETSGSESEA